MIKSVEVVNNKRLLLFLFIFFFIRVIYSYYLGYQEFIDMNSDGISYNGYALAILNKPDWLVSPDFLGHYRPPVYPLFVAVIYRIFGAENFFAVYFFQSIINTLTVYYIYRLSSLIFGEGKSLLCLFWSGFYLFYFYYAGAILRETLVFFLISYSFYHLWNLFGIKERIYFLKSRDLWKFLTAFAVLIHTDERYLFYLPFLSLLFILNYDFRGGLKRYSIAAVILFLFMVPWMIRNYIAYNSFVLINTRTLDMRSDQLSDRFGLLKTKEITDVDSESLSRINKNYPTEEERAFIKRGIIRGKRSAEEIQMIKKDIYPASTFLGRKLYFMKEMWIPFKFSRDYTPFPSALISKPWSLKHNILSIILYGTLIPFFIYGTLHLIKTKNKSVWLLTFPIIIQAILHFLMWGRERYRNPIDAFIIILGCYGIISAYDFFTRKSNLSRGIINHLGR